MKKTLLFKFFMCYILVAISMFSLLNTYGVNRVKHSLIEKKKTMLFEEANLISSEYMTNYYEGNMSFPHLATQLKTIDTFLDARIWIVDKDGRLVLDTRNSIISANQIFVTDLEPEFLEHTFSQYASLKNIINEPVLKTVLCVSTDFSVRGYIVILAPLDIIENDSIYFMDIINICFLIFLALMLVVFLYIYYLTVRPLHNLTRHTKSYAAGKMNTPLIIKSSFEYKDLSDAIYYLTEKLIGLTEYQKQFIANVSHDFRSPLTSIKGYIEAMKDGTIPCEIQGKYFDIILFETKRLTKLTSNLLTLSSFDNNKMILETSRFDINSVIKRISMTFEKACTEKKITLNLIFYESKTYVCADKEKIKQILHNLIDNAIKFSGNHSQIKISTTEKNGKIFVSIKDNGIGIPKECLHKIWERFYKTDLSRGKDKRGTGLGLPIVKEIIHAHGENINVISTQEVGTEFIFTLQKSNE